LYNEALPAKIGIKIWQPHGLLMPSKIKAQKMSKTYTLFRLKQIESMHGHWFISLREQDHAF